MRKLGKVQRGVLSSLGEHGYWADYADLRCRWVWRNYSGTRSMLNSLVARGLARKARVSPLAIYVITAKGRKAIAA